MRLVFRYPLSRYLFKKSPFFRISCESEISLRTSGKLSLPNPQEVLPLANLALKALRDLER
jgi:hypothetical protein